MILLKKLTWSNAFSYGENNSINFTDSKLIQLLGANGNGKSSIALILEEVLYNKNSKGIKKGDILNRYTSSKYYTISLEFTKNDVEDYLVETKRGSTQQVKLYRNGVDISSHTATGTYKLIEDIIGLDHKTFCQIVCQSNSSNLEFLTSADTARKKFLIELLNLSKYTKIGEVFKQLATEANKELLIAESKINTIKEWINKYSTLDFTKLPIYTVPKLQEDLLVEANAITKSLDDIANTNKKIIKNNTYIRTKEQINLQPLPERPTDNVLDLITKKADYDKSVKDATAFKNKMSGLGHNCPTCYQSIDQSRVDSIINEQNEIINSNLLLSQKEDLLIKEINRKAKLWENAKATHEEWEKLHQLIDTTLPTELLSEDILNKKLLELQTTIQSTRAEIIKIEKKNKDNSTHNDKLDLIMSQIADMQSELITWNDKLSEINDKLFRLNTLAKTFSTTGLVAYKIENLAKDLEEISNSYLSELSEGRFLISFQLAGSDKLNVVITDHGKDIQIEALSAGETTRVNVAVLLAIRKLMQSISDSRINLLFLDETISTLDIAGKEKLIEVLLLEENLNTILVSHEFTHPLLEKISIERTKEASILIKE